MNYFPNNGGFGPFDSGGLPPDQEMPDVNQGSFNQGPFNHNFYHQSFPNAEFQPNNPLHASAWRYPRTGPVFSLDPSILGRTREFWSQCVLGFLVDYRLFTPAKLNALIRQKWKTRGKVTVLKVGDLYALHCENINDKEDLLDRTYATFFGALMVLTRWFPDSIPRTIRFPYADVWVRVCGLPFEYLTQEVGNVAGHLLSHHFQVETFDLVPDNDYLRVKARLQLNEPLSPGFFISMDGGYLLWIQFRYEDIFKYCIRCGKVGHISACCRESMTSVITSVNVMLDRAQERGFAVFQTQSNHTMFNLDLRATPSTTKYVSSNIRLGNDSGASSSNNNGSGSEDEQMIDFGVGATLGGRVYPGMRFLVTSQPFAGPVLFNVLFNVGNPDQMANEDEGVHATPMEAGIQHPTAENDAPVGPGDLPPFPNEGIGLQSVGGSMPMEPGTGTGEANIALDLSSNGHDVNTDIPGPSTQNDVGTAIGDFIFEPGAQESHAVPPAFLANDPYSVYVNYNTPYGRFDRDLHIQEAISTRIEADFNWSRVEDDDRGYGQTFDPPPQGAPTVYPYEFYAVSPGDERPSDVDGPQFGNDVIITIDDSSSSHYSTPEWPFHSSDSESGNACMDGAHLQGDYSEVNTLLELNIGPSCGPHEANKDDSSGENEVIPAVSQGEVDLTLKTPTCYDPHIPIEVFQLRSAAEFSAAEFKKASSMDAAVGLSVYAGKGSAEQGLDIHLPLKKRKCRSEADGSEVPGLVLDSVGHAKAYLFQLAKKKCVADVRSSAGVVSRSGTPFRMYVSDDDGMSLSEESVKQCAFGVAEVGLSQPPRSP